jgi:hypothetical protein
MKKILCLLACLNVFAPTVHACTIPVFRYALERWDLTTYEIVVYHPGPLPDDLQKALDDLNRTPSKVNVEVTFVDLEAQVTSKLRDDHIKRWKAVATNHDIPWMLVRYETKGEPAVTAWSGPCTLANLRNLLDSPMRQAILSHLTRGASGVFVVMSSGDANEDRKAFDFVQVNAQRLEKAIKLVPQGKEGPQIRWPLPLKVWFPVLVLDRTKAEEAALVQLLLGTGEELPDAKGPIVFTIYGKGRALPGITGEDLTEKMLFQVTELLCLPCTCELKDAYLGRDLPMMADWKAIENKLFESVPAPTPEDPVAPAPMPVIEPPTTPECFVCRHWLSIAIGVAGGLVVVTGAWAGYSLRR